VSEPVLFEDYSKQCNMIPGPALRKECPYCGEVKELSSLRSGNTLRASHWSDTKSIYPMLPKNSEVQKCPGCGKYYFLADAKTLAPGKDPFKELWEKLRDMNFDEPV
jgi:ribosomal protein S27AE